MLITSYFDLIVLGVFVYDFIWVVSLCLFLVFYPLWFFVLFGSFEGVILFCRILFITLNPCEVLVSLVFTT